MMFAMAASGDIMSELRRTFIVLAQAQEKSEKESEMILCHVFSSSRS